MSSRSVSMPNPGFFDGHCDTVMKVLDAGEDFLAPGGGKHISFPEMIQADIRAQVFACFVLSSQHPGSEYERACQMPPERYADQGSAQKEESEKACAEAEEPAAPEEAPSDDGEPETAEEG